MNFNRLILAATLITGFGSINIVGASMEGAAVLLALNNKAVTIDNVVLLAPARGPAQP